MRILVHEFVTGGGLAESETHASLAPEGAAMTSALVADLTAIGHHEIVTTDAASSDFDALIESVDAVWLIAPGTGRCLERLAARVQRAGKTLLGSPADAIARASDKARLPHHLAAHGVAHPMTRAAQATPDAM